MNHYLVNLTILAETANIPTVQLIKATHSVKAIEIAMRQLDSKSEMPMYYDTRSCTLVNNVDVSILKAYVEG